MDDVQLYYQESRDQTLLQYSLNSEYVKRALITIAYMASLFIVAVVQDFQASLPLVLLSPIIPGLVFSAQVIFVSDWQGPVNIEGLQKEVQSNAKNILSRTADLHASAIKANWPLLTEKATALKRLTICAYAEVVIFSLYQVFLLLGGLSSPGCSSCG